MVGETFLLEFVVTLGELGIRGLWVQGNVVRGIRVARRHDQRAVLVVRESEPGHERVQLVGALGKLVGVVFVTEELDVREASAADHVVRHVVVQHLIVVLVIAEAARGQAGVQIALPGVPLLEDVELDGLEATPEPLVAAPVAASDGANGFVGGFGN